MKTKVELRVSDKTKMVIGFFIIIMMFSILLRKIGKKNNEHFLNFATMLRNIRKKHTTRQLQNKNVGARGKRNITTTQVSSDNDKSTCTFIRNRSRALSGYNDEHLKSVTRDDCKKACCKRDWCKSFDYYNKTNECDLSKTIALGVGNLYNSKGKFDHYSLSLKRTTTSDIDVDDIDDVDVDDIGATATTTDAVVTDIDEIPNYDIEFENENYHILEPIPHLKIGFTDQNEVCQKWNNVHNRRFHNNPDFQNNYCTKYKPLTPNKYKCYPINKNRVGSCDNHINKIKEIEQVEKDGSRTFAKKIKDKYLNKLKKIFRKLDEKKAMESKDLENIIRDNVYAYNKNELLKFMIEKNNYLIKRNKRILKEKTQKYKQAVSSKNIDLHEYNETQKKIKFENNFNLMLIKLTKFFLVIMMLTIIMNILLHKTQ